MSRTGFIIRRRRPWRGVVMLLGVVVLSAGGVYLAREWDLLDAHRGLRQAEQERDRLARGVRDLEVANQALRERVAVLERAAQVDKQAYRRVEESLKSREEEHLQLQEEIAFYRGIMAGGKGRKGLGIQSLKLERDGDRGYRFRIVLTQVQRHDKVIKGTVRLSVAGLRDGTPAEIELSGLSPAPGHGLPFRFRYFQRLEGEFSLPANFVPRRLVVGARASGSKGAKVEKSFEWPSLPG